MARGGPVSALLAGTAVLLASSCSTASDGQAAMVAGPPTTPTSAITAMAAPTTAPPAPVTTATSSTPPAETTTTSLAVPAANRVVTEQAWTPFATVGGVTLSHPSWRVERVGFHESNHDGARQLEPLPTIVASVALETRDRGTGSQTAADVVVDPAVEIRAPVTGTVLRAGTYVLYCDYSDDYVVIEPDDHPGWEVKVLHINGEQVSAGERVVAGETVLAPGPTQLQFESQVDELRTADPPWPHVHIEVVDPTIPDRPSGGGCG